MLTRIASPAILILLMPLSGDSNFSNRDWALNTEIVVSEPIEGIESRLVRDFDLAAGEFASGHRGVDVASWDGELIRSPITGWIHFAGQVVNRPVVSVLESEGELYSFEPACSSFLRGEKVSRGEVFAEVCAGDDGYRHCAATCLHISLRVAGEYLSPLTRFGFLKPSRLYPLDHLHVAN